MGMVMNMDMGSRMHMDNCIGMDADIDMGRVMDMMGIDKGMVMDMDVDMEI